MSQKSIILIIILLVLIVVGMFIFANLKHSELQQESVQTTQTEEDVIKNLYPEITRVDVKHYFIDGTHTLVGEINMPTPCDLLDVEAVIMDSDPEQVVIDFNVINNSRDCSQVMTAQRFKVYFATSRQSVISALFMGRHIDLNLIPADEGEKPEEFELFIKG